MLNNNQLAPVGAAVSYDWNKSNQSEPAESMTFTSEIARDRFVSDHRARGVLIFLRFIDRGDGVEFYEIHRNSVPEFESMTFTSEIARDRFIRLESDFRWDVRLSLIDRKNGIELYRITRKRAGGGYL